MNQTVNKAKAGEAAQLRLPAKVPDYVLLLAGWATVSFHSPVKKWSLYPFPLNLGCLCDLFLPVGYGGSDTVTFKT